MIIKQIKRIEKWLPNIYYISASLSLLFIVAQVFLARRAMIQSSEWEKSRLTIENIEHFKEKLKETALYGKTDVLIYADRLWPDFTTSEGRNASLNLREIYRSIFAGDELKTREDVEKSLAILNAFAYPIIMGYANEIGSYQSVSYEYNTYNNIIMRIVFEGYPKIGHHAKLLHRLWRVRHELSVVEAILTMDFNNNSNVAEVKENINNMLCFEGTEITHDSFRQYGKKLEKKLKKIQKEIEVFRKSSLK